VAIHEPVRLEGRILLGEMLRGGILPTPQLVDGLLYEGRIHSIAGSPGVGKTLLALHISIQVMRGGGRVLYLDAENGPALIAERLGDLGADIEKLDERFFYFPADLTLEARHLTRLAATVADVRPDVVVFDSLADLVAGAGLEENSNSDLSRWASKIHRPLKDAGIASLILDHIPKNAKGPRGAGSKVAMVDVQWNLETTLDFHREKTGEITLTNSKDRLCWLPKTVRFSVGGGVFARSSGTLEDRVGDGLTDKQRQALEYLEGRAEDGASWTDLLDELGGSKGTLNRALSELKRRNLIAKRGNRYHPHARAEPENREGKRDTEGSARFHPGSVVPMKPGTSGEVPQVPHPLRGGTAEPGDPASLESSEPVTRRDGSSFDPHPDRVSPRASLRLRDQVETAPDEGGEA